MDIRRATFYNSKSSLDYRKSGMSDPLAQIITLLRPGAPFAKLASASGVWRVRRAEVGQVFYNLTLMGSACLEVEGKAAVTLHAGDFVLIPASQGFTMSSVNPAPPADLLNRPAVQAPGQVRIGNPAEPIDTQQLVGHCVFGAPDAAFLVRLLPEMVVVRAEDRLGMLVRLVADEARAARPGRDAVLERLLEVLLIEALRTSSNSMAPKGLLRGLGDERLSTALQALHADPARDWTVAELARAAGLSRSSFFSRFGLEVGLSPMGYLTAWRMTLAKDQLRSGQRSIVEIARRLGYGSASAFSTAFSREVGLPPAQYARTSLPETTSTMEYSAI